MTESLVPTVRTTTTMLDFASALLAVDPKLTKEGAGVLWAQFAGETGDGVYCWNHNLGNVKHVRGDGYDYVSLRGVWEGFIIGDEDRDGDIDDDDRVMLEARMVASGLWEHDPSADHARAVGPKKLSLIATPNNAATWFRSYPNLDAAMVAFVSMKRTGRYASAWTFVDAGDPDGFAREIGRLGYYSASPDSYAAAMVKKHAAWMTATAWDEAADAREEASIVTVDQLMSEAPIVHPRVPLTTSEWS